MVIIEWERKGQRLRLKSKRSWPNIKHVTALSEVPKGLGGQVTGVAVVVVAKVLHLLGLFLTVHSHPVFLPQILIISVSSAVLAILLVVPFEQSWTVALWSNPLLPTVHFEFVVACFVLLFPTMTSRGHITLCFPLWYLDNHLILWLLVVYCILRCGL